MLMEDKKQNQQANAAEEQELALDDARRIKVLSPSMMVFKRFVRNKLAIIGVIIIVAMFLFSFVGPFFSPYKIDQKFMHDVDEYQNYATAVFNKELRFISADGGSVPSNMQTAVTLALAGEKQGNNYVLTAGQEITVEGDLFLNNNSLVMRNITIK